MKATLFSLAIVLISSVSFATNQSAAKDQKCILFEKKDNNTSIKSIQKCLILPKISKLESEKKCYEDVMDLQSKHAISEFLSWAYPGVSSYNYVGFVGYTESKTGFFYFDTFDEGPKAGTVLYDSNCDMVAVGSHGTSLMNVDIR